MRTYKTPAGEKTPLSFAVNETEFRCKSPADLAADGGPDKLREMFALLCGDDKGKVQWVSHLRPFFLVVMTETESKRFEAFVEDEANIIHTTLLYEIAQDLYEDYAGRPFGALVSSLASRLAAKQNSADGSPSQVVTSTP